MSRMLTMYNTKRDFECSSSDTAILPVGAVEQHGSHLPVGTDAVIAEAFSRRLAEHLDAYLLPTLAITSSIEHRESKGTVYVKADTLALIIRDICESLQYSGFRKMIVVNGHGGNWILKPTIRQLNRDFADRKQDAEVVLIHSSIVLGRQGEVTQHVRNDIHAGEKETSIMLHLCEDYVREPVPQTAAPEVPQDYMDYFDVADLMEDGYWGYPEAATKDKGEKLLELMVECALEYLAQLEATRSAIKAKRSDDRL